jgi:hypothetical protein
MKPFVNAETILSADVRRIEFTQHDFIGNIPSGTYNAVAARLFGMTYPEFLRYAREKYNATITGATGYSYLTFKNSADCDRLVKELNRRWDEMIKMRIKNGFSNNMEDAI